MRPLVADVVSATAAARNFSSHVLDCGALRHISTLADASRTVPVEYDRERRGGHAREDRAHAEPVLVALRSVPHTREVPDDAPVRALAACGCLVHAA